MQFTCRGMGGGVIRSFKQLMRFKSCLKLYDASFAHFYMEAQGRRRTGRPKIIWLERMMDDIKEKGLSGRRISSYVAPT